jgi:hypothetical protein
VEVGGVRFFEELGDELERVARATPAPRRGSGPAGWIARAGALVGRILRAAPAVAAVVVAIAVGAFFVLNTRSVRRPPATHVVVSPPGLASSASREQSLIDSAWRSAAAKDPGCALRRTRLTFSDASPSGALISQLGVLRRSADAAAYRPLLSLGVQGDPVYTRYIRLARSQFLGAAVSPQRVLYYIVPAGNVVGRLPVLTRCYAEQGAALRRLLGRVSEPLRASTLALAQQEREARQHPAGIAVQVVVQGSAGEEFVDAYAATTAQLAQRGATGSGFPSRNGMIVSGVVPDGVATVTLHYPAVRHGGKTAAAFNVTAHPVNNVFIVELPRTFGVAAPTATTWRAAGGTVIRTIHQPG